MKPINGVPQEEPDRLGPVGRPKDWAWLAHQVTSSEPGLLLRIRGYKTKGACRDLVVEGATHLLCEWQKGRLEEAVSGEFATVAIEKWKFDRSLVPLQVGLGLA